MNIFITFDYELFMGAETGSVQNCLIRPMRMLKSVAEKNKVFFTVFVDGAYLYRLYELKTKFVELKRDWDAIEANIRELSLSGHDIEFHFHPQWMYSNYDNGSKKWFVDLDHYKMSDVEDWEQLRYCFFNARALLEQIIGEKIVSFRAGGYCLEGIDYLHLFEENGILVDSSVARGLHCNTRIHNYDYRKIPSKIVYPFNSNIHIENQSASSFIELSISSIRWNTFRYLFYFRKKFKKYHPGIVYRDGNPIQDNGGDNLIKKIIGRLWGTTVLCSIDGPFSLFLEDYYADAVMKNRNELVLIGHPKNGSDISINELEKFIKNHKEDNFCTTKSLLK